MLATRDYVVRMPKDFTVVEACETVRCENWQYGWETLVDLRIAKGRDAAAWLRSGRSGRTFRELPRDGDVTVFRFEPRQRCFEEHRTRPARWLVRAGAIRQHADMGGWLEDFGEHYGRLEDQARKG